MGWKGKNIPQTQYKRLKKRYPQFSPAEIRKLYNESCNFGGLQLAITSSFTSSKSQPSIISSSTTSKSQPATTSSSKLSKPEQHQPSHSTLNPTALEALQNSSVSFPLGNDMFVEDICWNEPPDIKTTCSREVSSGILKIEKVKKSFLYHNGC